MVFETRESNSDVAPTERMRITSDGTVKIGTGTGNPILMLNASTSGTSVIQMGDTADNNIGQIQYVNSDDSMKFFANNAERVRIGSAGSFAIGTDAINANFAVGGAPGGGTGHLNVYTSNSGGWVELKCATTIQMVMVFSFVVVVMLLVNIHFMLPTMMKPILFL